MDSIASTATKELYGLTESNTVDDIFQWIGKYNQHWWRRNKKQFNYGVENITTYDVIFHYSTYEFTYSKEIEIDDTGVPTLKNPSTMYCENSSYYASKIAELSPIYFKINNKMYYLPEGSNGGPSRDYTVWWYSSSPDIRLSDEANTLAQLVYTYETKGEDEYIYSSDESAYPKTGILDNYEYVYLGVPYTNVISSSKIIIGSYFGNGKYGNSTPTKIPITANTKIIIIFSNYPGGMNIAFLINKCEYYCYITSDNSSGLTLNTNYHAQWTESTVNIWSSYADFQMNFDSRLYYYYLIE